MLFSFFFYHESLLEFLLIRIYFSELFKMVCEANETDVHVGIPVVMLPQDAGQNLKDSMNESSHGKLVVNLLKIKLDLFVFRYLL